MQKKEIKYDKYECVVVTFLQLDLLFPFKKKKLKLPKTRRDLANITMRLMNFQVRDCVLNMALLRM